jgi:hypothetical protein
MYKLVQYFISFIEDVYQKSLTQLSNLMGLTEDLIKEVVEK